MDLDPAPAELLDEIYGDEVAGCKGWKSVYATSSRGECNDCCKPVVANTAPYWMTVVEKDSRRYPATQMMMFPTALRFNISYSSLPVENPMLDRITD